MNMTVCCTLAGKISGNWICIKARTGDVRRLPKDAPMCQRVSFFDALFDEVEAAGVRAPHRKIRHRESGLS
ncbi:MAG: hypothetical protein PHW60_03455 [Kiritimatiellae bacterium]|nr:hypothetical protein [Kiritimatiellia bacterium]